MSDIGSTLPVALVPITENKDMILKWIQSRKQEYKSKISHGKQAIQDLIYGKVPAIEREVMMAQEELKQLETHENKLKNSVDTEVR